MKAAVLYGKEDLRVEDAPERELTHGEARVRVRAALTCGTDLKVFKRGYHARMIRPPSVFGHELAGVIVESASPKWPVGQRVVPANSAPCGQCLYCGEGQENLCDDLLFLNGAYSESVVIPARIVERNLLAIPDSVAFEDAALTEPLACVEQGWDDLDLPAGADVLVIGAGPIGLMFVALATARGASVEVIGRGSERLAKAERLGARSVFSNAGMGASDWVREWTKGRRAPDAVIEAVGTPETWLAATQLVRKGGRVNFFGGCPSGVSIPLDTGLMHYSSLGLIASFHHTPRTIRKAFEDIENGIIRAADFVDGECRLDELPGLFARMSQGNRTVKTRVIV